MEDLIQQTVDKFTKTKDFSYIGKVDTYRQGIIDGIKLATEILLTTVNEIPTENSSLS